MIREFEVLAAGGRHENLAWTDRTGSTEPHTMHQPTSFHLFTVLWIGVGGSLAALAGIWLATRVGCRASRCLGGVLFVSFSLLAAALAVHAQPPGLLFPLLALALAGLLVSAPHLALLEWGMRVLAKPVLIWGLLLAACPVVSLVYAYRLNRTPVLPAILVDPGPAVRTDSMFPRAVTDQGREIVLFQFELIASPALLDELLVEGEDLSQKVIRVAGPDAACNCHGWVFTGGQVGVASEDVDPILADNGYRVVFDVREGDVIVYRDNMGHVRHTGLVRFVGGDGLVLVESKWGPLGLYLHFPQDQPYGNLFAYYRSPRAGHALRLLPAVQRHAAESRPD
jgi:hypothetical protein